MTALDGRKVRASEPFQTPVDMSYFPDYDKVVAEPMDLGTIKARLEGTAQPQITTVDEFCREVQLVFSNCMLYNR